MVESHRLYDAPRENGKSWYSSIGARSQRGDSWALHKGCGLCLLVVAGTRHIANFENSCGETIVCKVIIVKAVAKRQPLLYLLKAGYLTVIHL